MPRLRRTTTGKQATAGKPPRKQQQKGGRCTTNHCLLIQLVLANIALAGVFFWQGPRLQKSMELIEGLEEGILLEQHKEEKRTREQQLRLHKDSPPSGNNDNNTVVVKKHQRHRAHWCEFWAHMGRPKQILISEFGYNTTVDATQTESWDLIFGGYPHCGRGSQRKISNWDWNMEHGLNQHLNRRGWSTLEPHQVWFPCMGCKDSYCNKRGLCAITRKLDPDSCFLLPEDRDRLENQMNSQTNKLWVLKQDSPTMHLHKHHGVSYIRNASEIPSAEDLAGGTYLVQPFVEQHMGFEAYHRRYELGLYLAVTSTSPLRVYAYNELKVALAQTVYFHSSSHAPPGLCALDTNNLNKPDCPDPHQLTKRQRTPTFAEFCHHYHLNKTQADRFQHSTRTLIGNILRIANPSISQHPVNAGITQSQAACFSFMRADLAVAADGTPSLYEINEFPYANAQGGVLEQIQTQAYRDLFHMMGLEKPALPVEEREMYELKNLGGWIPLFGN